MIFMSIPPSTDTVDANKENELPEAAVPSATIGETDSIALKPRDLFTDQLITDMYNCHLATSKSDTAGDNISQQQEDQIVVPEPAVKEAADKNRCNGSENSARARTRTEPSSQGAPIDRATLPRGCLAQVGKLYTRDGSAYIKRRPWDDPKNGVLLYSGRFRSGGVTWKLHGDSALLTSANRYIAQVTIRQVDQLDLATNFHQARSLLEKHLRVERVLVDEQLQDMQAARKRFETHLNKVSTSTIDNVQNAEDLFQLFGIVRMVTYDNRKVAAAIKESQYISDRTKSIIAEYVELESKVDARNKIFNYIKIFKATKADTWVDALRKAVQEGIATHRRQSQERCPSAMRSALGALQDKSVLFVTGCDLKLFCDIENGLDSESCKSVVPILFKKFLNKISCITTQQLKLVLPFTNKIYYFLCKSMLDVTEEIKSRSVNTNLVHFNFTGWTRTSDIEWKSSPSTLDLCFERQLVLLLRMLNHFEPGNPSLRHRFTYEFKIFGNVESTDEYRHAVAQANEAFGHKQDSNATMLPNELHVWICLLDDTIAHVISKNLQNVQLLSCLLKLFMNYSLSGNIRMDSLESLRVITHNTVRFLALAGAHVSSQSSLDSEILMKQIAFMSWATVEGKMSFLDYRDLVEVFALYWKQRNEVIEGIASKLESDHFQKDLKDIQDLLLQCMSAALEKKVHLSELVNFCRVFEEFLTDFNGLPLDWFVRLQQTEFLDVLVAKSLLSPVDNKWKNTEMQCHRVTNAKKFVPLFKILHETEEMPEHYLIKVVKELLQCVKSMTTKSVWSDGQSLTENDQMNAASLLIPAVRSSLLYLKEQPDYVSFERFFEESASSFHAVSSKSTSLLDFEKRINFIKESFWFIRNQNAIDIDTAIALCRSSNDEKFDEDLLKSGFRKYNEQLNEYISQNVEKSSEDKIKHIVSDIASNTKERLSSEWDFDFKQNTLPTILAGLGAVWSLHVSKDVASTGQYLKPHCIQIICVLRLLSTDGNCTGVRKHLAQVLTGQGKSLVLGLVAAVMALVGHSVNILCYSEYLARRDAQDFEEFYRYFSIDGRISYQTFDDAAAHQFGIFWTNATNYILRSIGLPTKPTYGKTSATNPMLLIDEVDVFFSENLYGETYNHGVLPIIPGLGLVQIKIWELARVQQNETSIRQSIEGFLCNSGLAEVQQFNALLNTSNSYFLFDQNKILYTNRSLFWEHINEMIGTAINVNKMKYDDSFYQKYRINQKGNITYRQSFGDYSEHCFHGYYNTFVYFRLKQSNFKPGRINYGYLNLTVGSVSYAKLPESYPLILGVTGTLTSLDGYEKEAVQQHYQISQSSIMPSFFGGTNLQFSEQHNFTTQQTPTSWMNSIFAQITTTTTANRSVLVVFDTDVTIDRFKAEFASQLDRLNVLTVDTESTEKRRIIDEAGVAKTITLATREMGRGVDYKSSVAVEKNGGIHVIQTFFSLDVKEETQIKGRTARKDNRGSYELIVYWVDLKKLKLTEHIANSSNVTYHQLDRARQSIISRNCDLRRSALQEANKRHAKTIEFYKDVGVCLDVQ